MNVFGKGKQMKKMIIFVLGMFLLAGCGDKEYYLSYGGTIIPDSNKTKYTEFVEKTISAASFHMTTADYEDPEDLVEEARKSADQLFSVTYYDLSCRGFGCDVQYIKFDQMTSEESKIYDSLLNVRSKNFNRAMR